MKLKHTEWRSIKESDIKLTETDIARIRAVAGPSPYFSTGIKAKLAAEYKQILLDKARAYAESGETALAIYVDQEEPVSAREALVHVVIYRENDRVFIASKQIYSSHYTEAGLSVAELIPLGDETGAKKTLAAYTIRLQVDLLSGSMGFMKRRAAQLRMLETLKTGLEGLRQCAETLLAEQRL